MTVTAIHTPSKVLDLDAVVRSAAVLTGAGLVGAITVGPAKLALLPIAGGVRHVVDLSIDSPQELALLSKDVAVVRAGDGSLWAVVDLAGSPRARLVARDVRALDMRPQGESALALLQDGTAGAVTLHKQEVSMRPFSIRGGALRACSVGEHLTWVVIDGDRGAELRIHPGATPELGTSARALLPAETAELDQLRGGASLSALWKRGVSTICLVTGTNKPQPKMAELEGKPADVAVLDDALLVTYADGRVSLYDATAIASAGRGPMSATFGCTSPARGKPRVAVVSPAMKGSLPMLWIGTTSGEILRAELAREGEKVEEPPKSAAPREEPELAPEVAEVAASPAPPDAPPASAEAPPAPSEAPPASSEDLGAEIAALKEALALAEGACEAESARARALEEERVALAAAIEAEKAARAAAIEALEAEHARVLEAQSTAYAASIRAQKAESESEHASALDAQKAGAAAALEALKSEHASALDAQKAEAAAALEALKSEHASALDAQKAGAAAALEALKSEHASALAAQKAGAAAVLEALKSEHTSALDAQKAEAAAALEALKSEHASALDAQKAEAAASMEALRSEHASALDAQKAESAAALEMLQSEHADALAAQKAESAASMEALRSEHAKALDAAASAIASERDKLRADMDTAKKEIEALVARARAAEASAHDKARACAEAEADLASLRAELTDERAKLDKDFVKWGDKTIPLDRARDALGSVLSRAQGVFGKRKGE
jgi:hypothetical protein